MKRFDWHHFQTTLVICAVLLACGSALVADVFSHILSFQGRLCAPDGKPLPDGPYVVQFAMYDADAGGTALWTETQGVTQVGGVFVAYLGSVTAFPADVFSAGDRWLGLKVGGDPEMPEHHRLTPSPWAIRAGNADTATNADKVDNIHASAMPTPNCLLPLDASGKFPTSVIPPDDDWTISGNNVYRLVGNVGIGTSTPADRLTVTDGNIRLYNTTDAKNWVIGYDSASDYLYIDEYGLARRVFIKNGGNVGIGTSNPAQKLDVAGTARMSGLQLTTSPVANYVLRSDSSGVGTWQPDGVALPFAGSATSGSPAFKITNSGTGEAVRGESTNGIGTYGWSANNAGVYGYSGAGTGVSGYASSRGGVEGLNGNWGNSGLLGTDDYGAYGEAAASAAYGVYGKHTPSGNFGYLGGTNYGVEGQGKTAGGYFKETDSAAYALLASQDEGITALGDFCGGYFQDAHASGRTIAGYGDTGVAAYGTLKGGEFRDFDATSKADVAFGDYGILAYGNTAGGYFEDLNGSGYAYVGMGGDGISAHGTTQGGFFADDDDLSGAHVAYGEYGIEAYGDSYGGHFLSTQGGAEAWVAGVWRGIWAQGATMGGHFYDTYDGTFAEVASSTYKIVGTGSVSFVQNHPQEADKVIVYACPEGDEVATYTRGTARLVNGVARVPLGETFKWVTNPDIGLTAHLTPRGGWSALYVESLSTSEMVVRSGDGSQDAAFDYIVYGLRIGFEEASIVQEKEQEAYIPSMANHRALYKRRPDLRKYSALERFKRMRAARGDAGDVDLTASQQLRDRIVEFDPAIHAIDTPAE
jgi:hypothetical protein